MLLLVRCTPTDERSFQMGRERQPVGVSGTRDGAHDEVNGQIHKVCSPSIATSSSNGMCCRGEGNELQSKTELINTSRQLAKQAHLVVTLAEKVAKHCTDKRMKRNLEDVLSKIPTISTQLKIVAAVKAASISSGGKQPIRSQLLSSQLFYF